MQIIRGKTHEVNISRPERVISGLLGGILTVYGINRRSAAGFALATAGLDLIYTGVSGVCHIYKLLGINTAEADLPDVNVVRHEVGRKIERTVTIHKPADELYRFWRNLENLPKFMTHLIQVTTSNDRSHWIAKGPAGKRVEWDAEIYQEKENEMLAWRSLENSDVDHAGSVHFTPVYGGRATEVKVVLNYEPPAGRLGAVVARLFGEEPDQQIREDLRKLKQLMETGEIPTTKGQPSGRRSKLIRLKKAVTA